MNPYEASVHQFKKMLTNLDKWLEGVRALRAEKVVRPEHAPARRASRPTSTRSCARCSPSATARSSPPRASPARRRRSTPTPSRRWRSSARAFEAVHRRISTRSQSADFADAETRRSSSRSSRASSSSAATTSPRWRRRTSTSTSRRLRHPPPQRGRAREDGLHRLAQHEGLLSARGRLRACLFALAGLVSEATALRRPVSSVAAARGTPS